jgi:hypothetical protein
MNTASKIAILHKVSYQDAYEQMGYDQRLLFF